MNANMFSPNAASQSGQEVTQIASQPVTNLSVAPAIALPQPLSIVAPIHLQFLSKRALQARKRRRSTLSDTDDGDEESAGDERTKKRPRHSHCLTPSDCSHEPNISASPIVSKVEHIRRTPIGETVVNNRLDGELPGTPRDCKTKGEVVYRRPTRSRRNVTENSLSIQSVSRRHNVPPGESVSAPSSSQDCPDSPPHHHRATHFVGNEQSGAAHDISTPLLGAHYTSDEHNSLLTGDASRMAVDSLPPARTIDQNTTSEAEVTTAKPSSSHSYQLNADSAAGTDPGRGHATHSAPTRAAVLVAHNVPQLAPPPTQLSAAEGETSLRACPSYAPPGALRAPPLRRDTQRLVQVGSGGKVRSVLLDEDVMRRRGTHAVLIDLDARGLLPPLPPSPTVKRSSGSQSAPQNGVPASSGRVTGADPRQDPTPKTVESPVMNVLSLQGGITTAPTPLEDSTTYQTSPPASAVDQSLAVVPDASTSQGHAPTGYTASAYLAPANMSVPQANLPATTNPM
jgi:hypothetical protein